MVRFDHRSSSAGQSIWICLAFLFFAGPHARADEFTNSMSDESATLRTGVGYKDNVSLSHFNPQASPFFRDGLEFDYFQLRPSGSEIFFMLDGDDWFYWNNPEIGREDSWSAAANFKKKFADDFVFKATAFYAFENQVMDLSAEENLPLPPARITGHTVSLQPEVRWNFETNDWTQIKLDATRQFFKEPADSFTRFGPEFSAGGDYGNKSEWSLKYEPYFQRYDHETKTDADGIPVSDAARLDFHQHVELDNVNYLDHSRRWQNTAKVFFEYNADNSAGYFNFYSYGGGEELEYQNARWDLDGDLELNRFDYPVQIAEPGGAEKWNLADVTFDFKARRQLTKWLKIFVEYEFERSFSNRQAEDYQADTVSAGLEWIWN